MDWFYRKGGRAFLWLARKPVQVVDTCVGELYRVAGLVPLMLTARVAGLFDNEVIDGMVDGLAASVRGVGQPAALRPARPDAGEPGVRLRRGRRPDPRLPLAVPTPRAMTAPSPTESLPLAERADLQPAGRGRGRGVPPQRARCCAGGRWPSPRRRALFSLPLYWQFDPTTARLPVRRARAPGFRGCKIHYTLGMDGISLLLVLLTTLIMPLCVLCSWRYIQTRVKEFMICLLIMETAMVGVFCALDFVLFFVFWEAMLIPMALLIGVWGGPRKIYAALKFFIYTMAGSVFLLVAIIALCLQGRQLQHPRHDGAATIRQTFQIWVFLAFFISFAIKVPMFPFHTWLPAAHVEAPTAGSVLLASILLKMGTYGFLRFSPADHALRHAALHALDALAVGGGHPLRRPHGAGAERPQEAGRLFERGAHGLRHAGHLRPEPVGHRGRGAGDDQPRRHHRRAVHRRRHHLRAPAHAATWTRPPAWARPCRSSPCSPACSRCPRWRSPARTASSASSWSWPAASSSPRTRASSCMICVVPGVVLAAAYMLRMLQRVAYGGTRNPDHSGLKDLDLREILTLAPLLVFVFWIGLHPEPFTRVLHASVAAPAGTNPAAAVVASALGLDFGFRRPSDFGLRTSRPRRT